MLSNHLSSQSSESFLNTKEITPSNPPLFPETVLEHVSTSHLDTNNEITSSSSKNGVTDVARHLSPSGIDLPLSKTNSFKSNLSDYNKPSEPRLIEIEGHIRLTKNTAFKIKNNLAQQPLKVQDLDNLLQILETGLKLCNPSSETTAPLSARRSPYSLFSIAAKTLANLTDLSVPTIEKTSSPIQLRKRISISRLDSDSDSETNNEIALSSLENSPSDGASHHSPSDIDLTLSKTNSFKSNSNVDSKVSEQRLIEIANCIRNAENTANKIKLDLSLGLDNLIEILDSGLKLFNPSSETTASSSARSSPYSLFPTATKILANDLEDLSVTTIEPNEEPLFALTQDQITRLKDLNHLNEMDGIILLVDDCGIQMKFLFRAVSNLINPTTKTHEYVSTKTWKFTDFTIDTLDRWVVICAADGAVAYEILKRYPITATITDQSMKVMQGIDLITVIRRDLRQHDPMYLALHTADTMTQLKESVKNKLNEELDVFLNKRNVDFIEKRQPLTGLQTLLEEKKQTHNFTL